MDARRAKRDPVQRPRGADAGRRLRAVGPGGAARSPAPHPAGLRGRDRARRPRALDHVDPHGRGARPHVRHLVHALGRAGDVGLRLLGARRRPTADRGVARRLHAGVPDLAFRLCPSPRIGRCAEVRWLAGVFLFTSDSARTAVNDFRPGGVGIISPVAGTDTSRGDFDDYGVGVFGQATATLFERLEIGAGLRYDYESRRAALGRAFVSGGTTLTSTSERASEEFDELLPRFDVAWRCAPGITVYGFAAKGFKAGGFNLDAPAGRIAFAPETSWTFEGGVKASLFDDRLQRECCVLLHRLGRHAAEPVRRHGRRLRDQRRSRDEPGPRVRAVGAAGRRPRRVHGLRLHRHGVHVVRRPVRCRRQRERPALRSGHDVERRGTVERMPRPRPALPPARRVPPRRTVLLRRGQPGEESYALANFRAGISGRWWRLEAWIRNAFDESYVPVAFQPSPLDPSVFVGESGAPRTYGITLSVTP